MRVGRALTCFLLEFHPSSKSGPESRSGPAARWGGVPKVAPEPSPYMVMRTVWLVALVFQNVAPELIPWPVGVLVVAPMGWCSKSWGGVPKSCPRIPADRWGGVRKVGVVFQKVVPESPLCILLDSSA